MVESNKMKLSFTNLNNNNNNDNNNDNYNNKHYKAPYHKNWYEHKPEPVFEKEGTTIIWDFAIDTHGKIDANKPDITIKDHKNKSVMTELLFPMDKNLSSGEFGKISK